MFILLVLMMVLVIIVIEKLIYFFLVKLLLLGLDHIFMDLLIFFICYLRCMIEFLIMKGLKIMMVCRFKLEYGADME